MKALIHRIYSRPSYAKAFEWGRLITITGSAQVLVQAITFVSGILIIRLLPTKEYGIYTLVTTMLGTMSMLADGGISTGVVSQAGRVWQDRQKLGEVLVTGIELRKKMALVCVLIAGPVLLFMLHYHGVAWVTSLLIIFGLISVFLVTLRGTLVDFPSKLWQD